GREHDWRVELEYTGPRAFTTPFGETIAANTPWRFGWERFVPEIAWRLEFFPTGSVPFDSTARVVATMDTTRLDLTWYQPRNRVVPRANVRTRAAGVVVFGSGRYRFRTIADDAIWVSIDGRVVLENPNPGESHLKEVEFPATGRHELVVQRWQVDG